MKDLPVAITQSWIWTWVDPPILIPSVFGLSFGALIWRLERCGLWLPNILIWASGGFRCVSPLSSRL